MSTIVNVNQIGRRSSDSCCTATVTAALFASDDGKRLLPVLAGVEFYWANSPEDGSFGLYCPPCGKVIKGGGGKTCTNIKNHFETPRHESAWKEWYNVCIPSFPALA
jgi:hypothetical protein